MSYSEHPTFEQCALASGLLTQQQIDHARATVRWSVGEKTDVTTPPSDRQLADRVVDMGLLNAWQAKQLLDGRTKFNLGPYSIVDSIGQGGMGQVFKAYHIHINRIVAIKVLPRDKSTPEAIASFQREIRALASLNHPKLVAALDAGQDGNVHYLVTEYVPGMDLRRLVRQEGPLGMAAAASITCQVAEGLEYAHHQGIVHRDIKPGNVLVSPEGEAKILDLGLAGPVNGEADPRHGRIVGTADYLSPDHVRDPWTPTPAWDIYSLGCTLYYAVTGKVPFPGGTTAEKARAHCELRPLDPRRLNPSLSAEFVDLMADMMAKDPAQRIPSAQEVIRRMRPFVGIPGATPPSIQNPQNSPLPPVSGYSTASPQYFGPSAVMAGPRPPSASTLADTKTDLTDIRDAILHQDRLPIGPAAFSPVLEDESGDSNSFELEIPAHPKLLDVLWPLTIYVLAPTALIVTSAILGHVLWTVLF